jgi:hypothetical protein
VASFRFLPSVARYMQQGAPASPATRGVTAGPARGGYGVRAARVRGGKTTAWRRAQRGPSAAKRTPFLRDEHGARARLRTRYQCAKLLDEGVV